MPKITVLVVDDEASVRYIVCKMLGDDYTVLEAMDGEVAQDMARCHQPDIILMDIMMPKIDGYSAVSMLKADEATKHIPIVMLTAVDQELNKNLAQKMGADGYITKPFRSKDLIDTIGQLLRKKIFHLI